MSQARQRQVLPRLTPLRWEIGIALLIKVIMLFGLWYLIFRWQDRPSQPDIAQHFGFAVTQPPNGFDLSFPPTQEMNHVR